MNLNIQRETITRTYRPTERHTNKEDKSSRQNTAEDRDNKSAWCDVVTCKITENWNAESLKYIIHVEQRRQHLYKVTHNIVPPHSACIPTPATYTQCIYYTTSISTAAAAAVAAADLQ